MESPPSSSTWSEAFILSDDSGLLLTNESASSSVSYESKSGRKIPFEFQDSDCEEKSLSQDDSFDGICGEHFNTLKKGRNWSYDLSKAPSSPIDPPPEFQDQPPPIIELFSAQLSEKILFKALHDIKSHSSKYLQINHPSNNSQSLLHPQQHHLNSRSLWSSDFLSFSPCHMGRPSSRSSLGSSRLSSSHNSLSVPTAHRVDDSTFITQAVSHDTLSSNQISDLYNVPFDSDVYAVPIDVVKPSLTKNKRAQQQQKKKRRNTTSYGYYRELELRQQGKMASKKNTYKGEWSHWGFHHDTKRHSVAGTSTTPQCTEPIHMTLQEVRQYLQTLYSSSSDSSDQQKEKLYKPKSVASTNYSNNNNNNNNYKYSHRTLMSSPLPNNIIIGKEPASNKNPTSTTINSFNTNNNMNNNNRVKKNTFLINIKNKKVKDSCDTTTTAVGGNKQLTNKSKDESKLSRAAAATLTGSNNNNYNNKAPTKLFSFKQALCNMFRFKRILSPEHVKADIHDKYGSSDTLNEVLLHSNNISSRALPPLPKKFDKNEVAAEEAVNGDGVEGAEEQALDFATSIQRVKDYGWYWGPISSEAAEKVLSNEPDGSFLVRDSSDDHYIFSLTFKLNNCVRHVRIEHDQGNFSFGSCTKFKSQTIVEFIENAVEHSRSGRYLFFLHRRPVIGPVRVQLLHPVSRFKQVQSLQHMCRFVIHKMVRRDLIPSLPLPRRIIDYLNTPHYYAEHFVDIEDPPEDNPASNHAGENEDANRLTVNNENMVENNNVQNANPNVPATNNYIIINNTSNTRQS